MSDSAPIISVPTIVDAPARAEALDITRSICVTAPAGSGKTELLTQRILKLLAVVDQPEQILAITFTRKAAAEMRERLLGALHLGLQAEEPSVPHKRLTWQLARAVLDKNATEQWHLLDNTGRLRLQTIDSLCQSIASDLPVMSQLGAKLKPVDDPSILYQQAVDGFFAGLDSDPNISEVLGQLLLHVDNNVDRLYKLFINMLPLRDQWLKHAAGFENQQATRSALEQTLTRWIEQELASASRLMLSLSLDSDLCACADFAGSQLQSMPAENAASAIGELAGITSLPVPSIAEHGRWSAIVELLCTKEGKPRKRVDKRQGFPAKSAAKDKEQQAVFEQRKKAMQALLGEIQTQPELLTALEIVSSLPITGYQSEHWDILEPLTTCLVHLYVHLGLVFGRNGQCDYNEITASALRAISSTEHDSDEASAIRYKWDQSIRHILVDEFQDTAVSQFDLLKSLTAEWHQDNLSSADHPRTLFVVGDGMQSIYGFRAAKVGLFLTAKASGVGDLPLHSVELVQNFRSTPAVVEWNNRHFMQAFPKTIDISRGAVPYAIAKSFGGDELTTEDDTACELLVSSDEQGRLSEAQTIVDTINAQQRIAPQQTIAILIRYRTHLADIIPALNSAGIEWHGVDLDPLQRREVIMDCLSLTRALCNPADNIAWLAILRAPWCGLSLLDLQQLIDNSVNEGASGKPSLDAVIHYLLNYSNLSKSASSDFQSAISSISEEGKQRLDLLAKTISTLWQQRGRKTLRQWVETAWLKLQGPLLACHSYDGDDQESVAAFFDLFEKLEQDCQSNGSCFSAALLEKSLKRLYTRSEITASADPDALPAVQIMTIHKSKGLEFDTVIIPGLDRVGPSDDKPLLSWNEHLFEDSSTGLVLCPLDAVGLMLGGSYTTSVSAKSGSDLYQFLRNENKRVSLFESTRLLYVAATRAKSKLLLLANLSLDDNDEFKAPTANALLSRLWGTLADKAKRVSVIDESFTEDDAHNEAVAAYPLLKRLSLASINTALSDAQRDADTVSVMGGDVSYMAESQSQEGQGAQLHSLIGTCVHEVFELLADSHQRSLTNTQVQSQQAIWRCRLLQLGVNPQMIDSALNTVVAATNAVLNDATGQWVFDAEHRAAHNEWPLSYSSDDTGKSVHHYVIDRSFIDKDNVRWIIDYKITAPSETVTVDDFIEQQKNL
ncbi:MAG: UvrD-helicase domain-containing protein, partial [Pseudomonadales bacterium]|nr:UvrD-helicase domain-containing protein [Pseudomonadales bacterium]